MSQQNRRTALGRGLGALIPGVEPRAVEPEQPASVPDPGRVPIEFIRPARTQPRTHFDEARLEELSESIRTQGLMQPIVVRRLDRDDYVIIAGERRWRASQRAGLLDVPVVIREATDSEAYQLALVENIQREDLDPLEEAEAYRHLVETVGLSQEAVARAVGKDRSTVSNALRLLKLPAAVHDLVASGLLTAGHARALMVAGDGDRIIALARQAVAEGWSVRECERRARAAAPEKKKGAERSRNAALNDEIEGHLRGALGAPVRLVHRGGKGRIEIRFHSNDELQRLIDLIETLEGR
jgi:ParB family chromosome partitioning protein